MSSNNDNCIKIYKWMMDEFNFTGMKLLTLSALTHLSNNGEKWVETRVISSAINNYNQGVNRILNEFVDQKIALKDIYFAINVKHCVYKLNKNELIARGIHLD